MHSGVLVPTAIPIVYDNKGSTVSDWSDTGRDVHIGIVEPGKKRMEGMGAADIYRIPYHLFTHSPECYFTSIRYKRNCRDRVTVIDAYSHYSSLFFIEHFRYKPNTLCLDYSIST